MSQIADEDLGEATQASSSSGADEPDPYAGLDEVTRAKRRLLDYGREQDPTQPRPQRRVAFRSAIVAFTAGVALGRIPGLRRRLFHALRWTARQMTRAEKRMRR